MSASNESTAGQVFDWWAGAGADELGDFMTHIIVEKTLAILVISELAHLGSRIPVFL